jgi:hypothetical protein
MFLTLLPVEVVATMHTPSISTGFAVVDKLLTLLTTVLILYVSAVEP